MMKLLPRQVLILAGVFAAVAGLFLLDRILGEYLNRTGYFTAMQPGIVEEFTTKEFSFTATVSAQGLRNEEVIVPKPAGTYRILALGDSFTYGWGVGLSESWPKLLQGELNGKAPPGGRKIEVINAGVPGADPTVERQICRAYFDRFAPDMVLLGFSSIDDAYQLDVRDLTKNRVWDAFSQAFPILTRLGKRQLAGNYYGRVNPGTKFSMERLWQLQVGRDLAAVPDLLSRVDPRIRDDYLSGRLNPGLIITAYQEPNYTIAMLDPINLDEALRGMDIRLRRFRERCTGSTPVVFVMLPTSSLVSVSFMEYRKGEGFTVDPRVAALDLDAPFSEIAKKNGFAYISLIPEFRKGPCVSCFYPWDYHYTKEGNRLVAGVVSGELAKILKL
jgi:hypothetical protein